MLLTQAPFNSIFPIQTPVLQRIVDRMKKIGFDPAHPILVWKRGSDAVVIDGHTRLQAALSLGIRDIPVIFREFDNPGDALDYAVSQQVERRNMTPADMLRYIEAADKLLERGRKKLAPNGANSEDHPVQHGKSAAKLAEVLNVLPGAVRDLHTIRTTLRYGTHFNHAVPRVAPVEFESDHDLPVSPWLLGIYLAEGSCGASASISNPESDILERIAESVPESDTTTPARNTIRIRKRQIGSAPSEFKKGLLALGLADKVSDTKFIPECYLFASVDDRLELLRGLCDGDGYVGNPGSIEICTASEQMAKDIIFLIRSLGGSAIMKKTEGALSKRCGRP